MNQLQLIWRIITINFILAKYRFDEFFFAIPLFSPFRFLRFLNPANWFAKNNKQSRGERLRLLLEELGPIFVKLGQALSTRPDLLPHDIASELSKLQDRVPPFSNHVAKSILEKAYHQSIEDLFKSFENNPLASASIAQVHGAVLHDGSDVVVKILRPNMRKRIKKDIALMYSLARLLEKYWSEGSRLKPTEIVSEFEHNLLDELDLMREAANASQLRRNFIDSELLYIPEIYWDYARTNSIVMERIYGKPINHVSKDKETKVNKKILAEMGVEIFFTQVFRDNFFHADMHPGNIFVSETNPNKPKYIAVDFGIMGSLTKADQRYLAENLLAFFNRDYRAVARLHVASGWVDKDTRVDYFEAAIRTCCEPIFEKPLKEISFGQLLLRLFQTAREFNMEVQPQLVLLQKTLLNIEGLGRELYPDLDLWHTAKPFLETWMKKQLGTRAILRKIKENGPYWIEKLPELPELIHGALDKINSLEENKNNNLITKNQKSNGFLAGLGSALIIAAILPSHLPPLKLVYSGLGLVFLWIALFK